MGLEPPEPLYEDPGSELRIGMNEAGAGTVDAV